MVSVFRPKHRNTRTERASETRRCPEAADLKFLLLVNCSLLSFCLHRNYHRGKLALMDMELSGKTIKERFFDLRETITACSAKSHG